jgi:hypothetical protein
VYTSLQGKYDSGWAARSVTAFIPRLHGKQRGKHDSSHTMVTAEHTSRKANNRHQSRQSRHNRKTLDTLHSYPPASRKITQDELPIHGFWRSIASLATFNGEVLAAMIVTRQSRYASCTDTYQFIGEYNAQFTFLQGRVVTHDREVCSKLMCQALRRHSPTLH